MDKSKDLWSISDFFGCFGFGGNFGGILPFLLCALIALLMLSVTLVIELDFDDVANLLGMRYFSPIALSIFCLVDGKLLVALPTCVFGMPFTTCTFSTGR